MQLIGCPRWLREIAKGAPCYGPLPWKKVPGGGGRRGTIAWFLRLGLPLQLGVVRPW